MKKILMAVAVLAVAGLVQADLLTWNSQFLYTGVNPAPGTSPSGDGVDGYGWQTDIALAGSLVTAPSLIPDAGTAANYGWYDGSGYYVGGFQFTAEDVQDVVMRIFSDNGYALDSQVLSLPDLPGNPGPGETNVQFDFTGSTWVAVPEPATIGLMGIAGLGLFLARRKARR